MEKIFFTILFVLGFTTQAAFAAQAITADIINTDQEKIGTVTLTQGTEGVLLHIKAHDLPPGFHGMHFHEHGSCSDKGFLTAKGHVMPHKKPHGFLHPEGPHAGNLPNLVVAKDGTVEVELYTQMVSLNKDHDAYLLDEDGSAFIIHADQDDHKTQPIGGSGKRIACANLLKNASEK